MFLLHLRSCQFVFVWGQKPLWTKQELFRFFLFFSRTLLLRFSACTWLRSDVLEETHSGIHRVWSAPPSCLVGWGGNGNKVIVRRTGDVLKKKKKQPPPPKKKRRHEGSIKLYVFCLYHLKREQIKERPDSTWKPRLWSCSCSCIFTPDVIITQLQTQTADRQRQAITGWWWRSHDSVVIMCYVNEYHHLCVCHQGGEHL